MLLIAGELRGQAKIGSGEQGKRRERNQGKENTSAGQKKGKSNRVSIP